MIKLNKFEKKCNSLLYNHLWLKYIVEYGFSFIITLISAAIFAFGFKVFVSPNASLAPEHAEALRTIASGGASGSSQVISLAINLLVKNPPKFLDYLYQYLYIVINIPLVIFAFKKIGKRFAVFTGLNVALVALLTFLFGDLEMFVKLSVEIAKGGLIARALVAGVCTGISSALAFKIDASAGGFDVVSYYISMKKGNSTGHYIVIINSVILVLFSVLNTIDNPSDWAASFGSIFYSTIYLLTTSLIIDLINIRNKKSQIEIITNDEQLPDRIMAYIPHGATLLKGKGVYSGNERYLIHMVVSANEVKKVIKIINELDPRAFVNVTTIQQVYGSFHMKTIK